MLVLLIKIKTFSLHIFIFHGQTVPKTGDTT